MASIFKRGSDKRNRKASYWVEYVDHTGKRRRKKGFTDYELTQQLAGKLESEVMLRDRGMLDPQAETFAEHRKLAIEEHLTAFENGMKQRGTTAKHVKLTMSRVRAVVNRCGVKTLADLLPERVQLKLNEMRTKDDLGHKTYNHYVQAIDSFCKWLVRTDRITANPLNNLARLNNEVDVRHRRRALTPEEATKLIESASESDKRIQGYDGGQRARIPHVLFDRAASKRVGQFDSRQLQSGRNATDGDSQCRLLQASANGRVATPSGIVRPVARLASRDEIGGQVVPEARSQEDLANGQARFRAGRDSLRE